MDMPSPSAAHKRLERLAGAWTGEERMSPSPWDPAGGVALGQIENRMALGGFAVIQDYRQIRNGATSFEGHGVFTFDATRGDYVLHWFDSMGTPVNEYRGGFEAEVLSLVSHTPHMHARAVFDLSREDAYVFRMDMSQDENEWQTLMTGSYTRG